MRIDRIISYLLIASGFFIGCNSKNSSNEPKDPTDAAIPFGGSGTVSEAASVAFPRGLAVSSPFSVVANKQGNSTTTTSARGIGVLTRAISGAWASNYTASIEEIDGILAGSINPTSAFSANNFFTRPARAHCFGPNMRYENHPDGPDAPNAELPGGDLGLWMVTEPSTGEACAAAQVNRLMAGIEDQSQAALRALATLIAVAQTNSIALPLDGSNIDLTSQMNATGITDVTFSNATLANAGLNVWNYAIGLTFTKSGKSHNIAVELSHTADATGASANYEGLLFYRVTGDGSDFPGGNCPPATARTLNGSLRYVRSGANSMNIQSRSGIYCGADVDGRVVTASETDFGHVDPSNRIPDTSDGWSENFNVFVANFDPANNSGQYSFAWQAGSRDSHSRIFHIGINNHDPQDGEAYFGYGDPIHATDGSLIGMICNWAGPGSNKTVHDAAQRQFVRFNETAGIFEQPDAASNPTGAADIMYAPTNSCDHDGSGDFKYDDLNGNGTLSDEAVIGAMTADLFQATSGKTIAESIADRGFTIPSAPGGWPAE